MVVNDLNDVSSQSHVIASSTQPGLNLRLRSRAPSPSRAHTTKPTPLLMVHGATISSLLWDHPLAQWSWMNRLAQDGFIVYALDLRGYGESSRLGVMQAEDPTAHAPYARAADVQDDVLDAIAWIQAQHGVDQVDLLGGSWGSIICGLFATTEHVRHVRRLVLYAPIYDEGHTKTSWWHGAVDPEDQTRVNPKLGAWRWVTRQSLLARWDDEIPLTDKTAWRSDAVFEALWQASLAQDPWADKPQTPAFRAPNGTLVDLFGAYTGRPVFDAKEIKLPTLLVRGDHDDTSSRIGTVKLFDEISAATKVYCEVGNGAHFVILEHQSDQVHQAVTGFLSRDS